MYDLRCQFVGAPMVSTTALCSAIQFRHIYGPRRSTCTSLAAHSLLTILNSTQSNSFHPPYPAFSLYPSPPFLSLPRSHPRLHCCSVQVHADCRYGACYLLSPSLYLSVSAVLCCAVSHIDRCNPALPVQHSIT
jgi:hypothetical protein